MSSKGNKDFDIALKIGESAEVLVKDIFEGKELVEVKNELKIWTRTGNIALEVEYRKTPSGLFYSKSDWWVTVLSIDEKPCGMFVFRTEVLREKLKNMIKDKKISYVMGGDNNASKLYLIPIKNLWSFMFTNEEETKLSFWEKANDL